MYTVADPGAVASCIATTLGSIVQPEGNRLVVASVRHPGVRYSVGPNEDGDVYPTQVAVIGQDSDTVEARRVSACIVAGSPR